MKFPPYPDIERLVPHQGHMCLLDAVIDHGESWVEAEATIRSDNIFAEGNDRVGAWVGLEYMAQTVAAWAGLRAFAQGRSIKLGFLVNTRRYTSEWSEFPRGSRVVVRAEHDYETDNGLAVFHCRIRCGTQNVAQATLTVFQPPDAAAFLEGAIP